MKLGRSIIGALKYFVPTLRKTSEETTGQQSKIPRAPTAINIPYYYYPEEVSTAINQKTNSQKINPAQSESLSGKLHSGAKVFAITAQGFHTPGTNNDSIHLIQNPKYDICCVVDGVTAKSSGHINSLSKIPIPKATGKFWAKEFPERFAAKLSQAKSLAKDLSHITPPQKTLSPDRCRNLKELLTWLLSSDKTFKLKFASLPENSQGSNLYKSRKLKSHYAYIESLLKANSSQEFYKNIGVNEASSETEIFYALMQTVLGDELDLRDASLKQTQSFANSFIAKLASPLQQRAKKSLQHASAKGTKEAIIGNLAKYKTREIVKLISPAINTQKAQSKFIKSLVETTSETAEAFYDNYHDKVFAGKSDQLYGGITAAFYIHDKDSNKHWLVAIGDSEYSLKSKDGKNNITDFDLHHNFGSNIYKKKHSPEAIYPPGFNIREIPQEAIDSGAYITLHSDGLTERIKRQIQLNRPEYELMEKLKSTELHDDAKQGIEQELKELRADNSLKVRQEIHKRITESSQKDDLASVTSDIIGARIDSKGNTRSDKVFSDGYSRYHKKSKSSDDISLMVIDLPGIK